MAMQCPKTGENGCVRIIKDSGRKPRLVRNDLIHHLWGAHNMDIIAAAAEADRAIRERERESKPRRRRK